tara:strand:+ start:780 stop:1859 length:1080 start_codon:yes stop_codon:yes gene_type:complete
MDGIFSTFLDQLAVLATSDTDAETGPIPRVAAARPAARRMMAPGASFGPAASPQMPAAIPLTGRNQVLVPSQDWDWTTAASGSIPTNQFYLADTLPQSTENGSEFAASSDSFSKNYRLFLDMIDLSTFPSAVNLQLAKNRIIAPSGTPAGGTAPPGWTKIMRSGVLRWAPNWIASDTCKNWTNQAVTKPPSKPQTITISLGSGTQQSAIAADLIANHPSLQPETLLRTFNSVAITAQNWGKITLTPGEWFESGLLQIGQSYMKNPAMFFGSSGLLRGRVSAFYVGFNVTLKFSGEKNLTSSQRSSITKSQNVELLGIPLTLDQSGSNLTGSNPIIAYTQSRGSPEIIAVEIETYPLLGT